MHFNFFDDLISSDTEASPKFRFNKTIRRNYSSMYLNNVLKNLLKIFTKIYKLLKML